jgi:hypothetical protein
MPVDQKPTGQMPSATGLISRFACARLEQAGIDVAPLLKQAKLIAR